MIPVRTRSFLWPAGVVVAVVVFLGSLVAEYLIPLLPDLVESIGLPIGYVGWYVSCRAAGRLLVDLPAGRFIDSRGLAVTLPISAAFILVGTASVAFAPSGLLLLAAGLIVGAGSAVANTSGMAYFTSIAPHHRRGASMSVYSIGLLGGGSLGPAVAGWVAAGFGWEQALLAGIGLGVVMFGTAIFARRLVPEAGFGYGGAASSGQSDAAPDGKTRVALWMVMFSVSYTISGLMQTMVPIIGVTGFDLSVGALGAIMGLAGASRLIGTMLAGVAADRWRRKSVLIPGILFQCVGILCIVLVPSLAGFVVGLVVLSFFAVGVVLSSAILGDLTSPNRIGRELSRYRFIGDFGLLVGPAVSTVLATRGMYTLAVAFVGVLLVLSAILVALWVPETNPRSSRASRPA